MTQTHTHTHDRLAPWILKAVVLATFLSGCSSDEVTESATLMTTTSTSTTDAEPDPCAKPQFEDAQGPGVMVECAGEVVDSVFTHNQCELNGCDNPQVQPIDPILFPGGEVVGACCESSATEEQLLDACKSDCAHAACLEAIERFQALINDPDTVQKCKGYGLCIDNVLESLNYYKAFVTDNFDLCVTAVENDIVFGMGSPGCVNNVVTAGCLPDGALDINCNVTGVNTDVVLEPVCGKALHQPPPPARAAGTIAGGTITVTGVGKLEETSMIGTSVQTAYYACSEATCPLVLEVLDVRAADFQIGPHKVENLKADLVRSAYGQSDGAIAAFAPGSILIHVTADVKHGNSKNVVAIDGLAFNEETALAETAGATFSLSNAVFSMGPLRFRASVAPTPCTPM